MCCFFHTPRGARRPGSLAVREGGGREPGCPLVVAFEDGFSLYNPSTSRRVAAAGRGAADEYEQLPGTRLNDGRYRKRCLLASTGGHACLACMIRCGLETVRRHVRHDSKESFQPVLVDCSFRFCLLVAILSGFWGVRPVGRCRPSEPGGQNPLHHAAWHPFLLPGNSSPNAL